MPTLVDVPNVGEIEFPDSMSTADIQGVLRQKFPPAQNPNFKLGSVPLEPMSGFEVQKGIAENIPTQSRPDATNVPADETPLNPLQQLAETPLMKGLSKGAVDTAKALVEPKNLMVAGGTMVAAAIAPEIGMIVGGVLGAQTLGETLGTASVAVQQGDVQGAAEQVAPALLGAAMVGAPLTAKAAKGSTLAAETIIEASKPKETLLLPGPGETGSTILAGQGSIQNPVRELVAGDRVEGLPPFVERTWPQAIVNPPEGIAALQEAIQLSKDIESTAGGTPAAIASPKVDLLQLQKIMRKNTVDTMESWADGVIKDKLSGSSANPYFDPEFLAAASVKGAILIKRGVTSFADWSDPLVKQFGEGIKPHLEGLYEQSKAMAPLAGTEVNQQRAAQEMAPAASTFTPTPQPDRVAGIGIVPQPSSEAIARTVQESAAPVESMPSWLQMKWRGFAMESLPKITAVDRITGEAGVRASSARNVARGYGELFADKVLKPTGVDDMAFGTALTEDNLRSVRQGYEDQAAKARESGLESDAVDFEAAAQNVRTFIGERGSPFQSESDYQSFLASEPVQIALERHKRLWEEQKDPLYLQANDLDPNTALATRGLQTGARINLKGIREGDIITPTTIGLPAKTGIRQLATLKRRDPFSQRATGMADSYEGSYSEIMAHGFEREMPVAAQHEYIRKLIASGNAVVSNKAFEPALEIKGEPAGPSNLLSLRPWSGQFLHIRQSLNGEFRAGMGLTEKMTIPLITKAGEAFTKMSIAGLAEGTTHMANLFSEIFTGLGPTGNPLMNGLLKAFGGRLDLLYSVPKVIVRAFRDNREAMLDIGRIGAAKQPFENTLGMAPILTKIDEAVRLTMGNLHDAMAEGGWLEKTETSKRELINQVGQYNKQLQPFLIRLLRETQIQPFATAAHTFTVSSLRTAVGATAARPTSTAAAWAIRADKLGGIVGFVGLTMALRYMLNGNVKTLPGTPLTSVAWHDKDGNIHFVDIGKVSGLTRAWNKTGVLPALNALDKGLTPNDAINAGLEAEANALTTYAAGPLARTAVTAATGKTLSVPQFQRAAVTAPTDSVAPLRSQMVQNLLTALKESHPIVSTAVDIEQGIKEGKSTSDIVSEVGKNQVNRFWPGTPSQLAQSDKFPKTVHGSNLNKYNEWLLSKGRKLPLSDRGAFFNQHIQNDVEPQDQRKVRLYLKMHGAGKS